MLGGTYAANANTVLQLTVHSTYVDYYAFDLSVVSSFFCFIFREDIDDGWITQRPKGYFKKNIYIYIY